MFQDLHDYFSELGQGFQDLITSINLAIDQVNSIIEFAKMVGVFFFIILVILFIQNIVLSGKVNRMESKLDEAVRQNHDALVKIDILLSLKGASIIEKGGTYEQQRIDNTSN